MRPLRYLNGRTPSPVPAEARHPCHPTCTENSCRKQSLHGVPARLRRGRFDISFVIGLIQQTTSCNRMETYVLTRELASAHLSNIQAKRAASITPATARM